MSPKRLRSLQLPEDRDRVKAFDAALRKNKTQLLEQAAATREKYASSNIGTLNWEGWPLRPLFLQRDLLQYIAKSIHTGFTAMRDALVNVAKDRKALLETLPLPESFFDNTDFVGGLKHPDFLFISRADGYLYRDRFVMGEPNFGNGWSVSCSYTELLHDNFVHSPVLKSLGWSAKRNIPRPFMGVTKALLEHPKLKKGCRFIALLAHRDEYSVLLSWQVRVIQQIYYAQKRWKEMGIESQVCFEDGIEVDAKGVAREKSSGRKIDLVVQLTIGTTFLFEEERLKTDLKMLGGATIGKTPFIQSNATLVVDKGTMPFMAQQPVWPFTRRKDGFSVELAKTWFPRQKEAKDLRWNKDRYVLKKSFDGKDTHIGVSTPGRRWNNVLDRALDGKDYVVQRYSPLPKTIMPVTVDGKHIEWIPVRVELTPFVVRGRYAGSLARYAPDTEGIVLAPPPEGMGMTMAFGT